MHVFSLSPAMHLVPVYDVLLCVCECMTLHENAVFDIIASVFGRTGQVLKLKSSSSCIHPHQHQKVGLVPAYISRLWDCQKTLECMVTPIVLTGDNLVPWRLILNIVHSTFTIKIVQRSCNLFQRSITITNTKFSRGLNTSKCPNGLLYDRISGRYHWGILYRARDGI